jgi:hypothetical protein
MTTSEPEEIAQQRERLATYRRTLAHLLHQAAQYGGVVFAPPQTANGIAEARAQIQQLKTSLRAAGVVVEDEPYDTPAATELSSTSIPISGATFNQPNWSVSGDVTNVAGDQTINTDGGPAIVGNQLHQSPIITGTVKGDVISAGTIYYQPPVIPLDREQQRNRRAMLEKMKTIWISGLLEHSLAEVVRIDLELVNKLDAVDLPLQLQYQELNRQPHSIPTGTPIIDVFTKMGRAILILGAPGSGKTTMLLELARDLIARAEQDENHPVPIIFNLSSWTKSHHSLIPWLLDELNERYDVPYDIGDSWLSRNALLPLLDGLDETASDQREACVEAINSFRQTKGMMPIAVCSRETEYELLTTRLRLQGAVIVQPLTLEQINSYFAQVDGKLESVRLLLQKNDVLRELVGTPLMLSVISLAYQNIPINSIITEVKPDHQREHLFAAYVDRMLARRGVDKRYTRQEIIYWLIFLSRMLYRQNQTIFFIEQINWGWMPQSSRRNIFNLIALLVSATGLGLIYGLLSGLPYTITTSMLIVMIVGLIFIQSIRMRKANIVEKLTWSRPSLPKGRLVNLPARFVLHFIVALILPLAVALSQLDRESLSDMSELLQIAARLSLWVVFGVVTALMIATILWLIIGLTRGEIENRTTPNQGIWRSALHALGIGLLSSIVSVLLFFSIFGFLFRLLFGTSVGLSVLNYSAMIGLSFGVAAGLWFGGMACLQHIVVRLILTRSGVIPLDYVHFLDYCADRILLRKVGGGYIFVHRLLMDYFAELDDGATTRKDPMVTQ